MKIFLALILLPVLFIQNIYAYTIVDVNAHNTSSDCWVVFENGVYDLTKFVRSHDGYLNIRSWCGKDITQDFKTKANSGSNHRSSSYALLESYKIGTLENSVTQVTQTPVQEVVSEEDDTSSEASEIINTDNTNNVDRPYNIIIPIVISICIYWIPLFLINKHILKLPLRTFNGFWNTLLLLLLLFPAFGFGVFMILRYQYPSLGSIKFNFMYWHVELSLVMGILGLSHFLSRIRIYLLQIKSSN